MSKRLQNLKLEKWLKITAGSLVEGSLVEGSLLKVPPLV